MAMSLALLGGCSAGVGAMPGEGVASYDALRAAQEACVEGGGTLKLKRNGNPRYLEDYGCEKY